MTTRFRFEEQLLNLISNTKATVAGAPLNLGGMAGVSGGIGQPPGGYLGYLPQAKIAYDLTEAATAAIPSGASLVDNLNHIRYSIQTLETDVAGLDATVSGITLSGIVVKDDGITIKEGTLSLDFQHATVISDGDDGVIVTFDLIEESTFYTANENLIPQVTSGTATQFTLDHIPTSGSVQLYYNGLRQSTTSFFIDESTLYTDFVVHNNDTLVIDYTIAPLINDFVSDTDLSNGLATKADAIHTHIMSDITDLELDANYVGGIAVPSGTPSDGNIWKYSSALGTYYFTDIGTSYDVNQQFVFTFTGAVASGTEGTYPQRIYAGDVNSYATISEIFCCVDTVPDNSVKVDVMKNGISIFDAVNYVEISGGYHTATKDTDLLTTMFVKNDYFQVELVEGDISASDLTVHIRYSYTL